jgi:hypothetical protein
VCDQRIHRRRVLENIEVSTAALRFFGIATDDRFRGLGY